LTKTILSIILPIKKEGEELEDKTKTISPNISSSILRVFAPQSGRFEEGHLGSQLSSFTEKAYNEDGFNDVVCRIKANPEEAEIEFVEEYDDMCVKCNRRVRDEKGSIWGRTHSCSSSQNADTVAGVKKTNQEVLQKLGLQFSSVVSLKDLLRLLSERIPTLVNPESQKYYKNGITILSLLLRETNSPKTMDDR
jgi:hypothetical protein